MSNQSLRAAAPFFLPDLPRPVAYAAMFLMIITTLMTFPELFLSAAIFNAAGLPPTDWTAWQEAFGETDFPFSTTALAAFAIMSAAFAAKGTIGQPRGLFLLFFCGAMAFLILTKAQYETQSRLYAMEGARTDIERLNALCPDAAQQPPAQPEEVLSPQACEQINTVRRSLERSLNNRI